MSPDVWRKYYYRSSGGALVACTVDVCVVLVLCYDS
jgi:hypothetical protein